MNSGHQPTEVKQEFIPLLRKVVQSLEADGVDLTVVTKEQVMSALQKIKASEEAAEAAEQQAEEQQAEAVEEAEQQAEEQAAAEEEAKKAKKAAEEAAEAAAAKKAAAKKEINNCLTNDSALLNMQWMARTYKHFKPLLESNLIVDGKFDLKQQESFQRLARTTVKFFEEIGSYNALAVDRFPTTTEIILPVLELILLDFKQNHPEHFKSLGSCLNFIFNNGKYTLFFSIADKERFNLEQFLSCIYQIRPECASEPLDSEASLLQNNFLMQWLTEYLYDIDFSKFYKKLMCLRNFYKGKSLEDVKIHKEIIELIQANDDDSFITKSLDWYVSHYPEENLWSAETRFSIHEAIYCNEGSISEQDVIKYLKILDKKRVEQNDLGDGIDSEEKQKSLSEEEKQKPLSKKEERRQIKLVYLQKKIDGISLSGIMDSKGKHQQIEYQIKSALRFCATKLVFSLSKKRFKKIINRMAQDLIKQAKAEKNNQDCGKNFGYLSYGRKILKIRRAALAETMMDLIYSKEDNSCYWGLVYPLYTYSSKLNKNDQSSFNDSLKENIYDLIDYLDRKREIITKEKFYDSYLKEVMIKSFVSLKLGKIKYRDISKYSSRCKKLVTYLTELLLPLPTENVEAVLMSDDFMLAAFNHFDSNASENSSSSNDFSELIMTYYIFEYLKKEKNKSSLHMVLDHNTFKSEIEFFGLKDLAAEIAKRLIKKNPKAIQVDFSKLKESEELKELINNIMLSCREKLASLQKNARKKITNLPSYYDKGQKETITNIVMVYHLYHESVKKKSVKKKDSPNHQEGVTEENSPDYQGAMEDHIPKGIDSNSSKSRKISKEDKKNIQKNFNDYLLKEEFAARLILEKALLAENNQDNPGIKAVKTAKKIMTIIHKHRYGNEKSRFFARTFEPLIVMLVSPNLFFIDFDKEWIRAVDEQMRVLLLGNSVSIEEQLASLKLLLDDGMAFAKEKNFLTRYFLNKKLDKLKQFIVNFEQKYARNEEKMIRYRLAQQEQKQKQEQRSANTNEEEIIQESDQKPDQKPMPISLDVKAQRLDAFIEQEKTIYKDTKFEGFTLFSENDPQRKISSEQQLQRKVGYVSENLVDAKIEQEINKKMKKR